MLWDYYQVVYTYLHIIIFNIKVNKSYSFTSYKLPIFFILRFYSFGLFLS